jgi:hypothetical protein
MGGVSLRPDDGLLQPILRVLDSLLKLRARLEAQNPLLRQQVVYRIAVNGQEQMTRKITKLRAAEQEIFIRFRISRAVHNRGRARGNLQSTRGPWRSRLAKHRPLWRPIHHRF